MLPAACIKERFTIKADRKVNSNNFFIRWFFSFCKVPTNRTFSFILILQFVTFFTHNSEDKGSRIKTQDTHFHLPNFSILTFSFNFDNFINFDNFFLLVGDRGGFFDVEVAEPKVCSLVGIEFGDISSVSGDDRVEGQGKLKGFKYQKIVFDEDSQAEERI